MPAPEDGAIGLWRRLVVALDWGVAGRLDADSCAAARFQLVSRRAFTQSLVQVCTRLSIVVSSSIRQNVL